jgi:hypothetical protein
LRKKTLDSWFGSEAAFLQKKAWGKNSLSNHAQVRKHLSFRKKRARKKGSKFLHPALFLFLKVFFPKEKLALKRNLILLHFGEETF